MPERKWNLSLTEIVSMGGFRLAQRVKTSEDPFITHKLLECCDGDLDGLTARKIETVLDVSDADRNREAIESAYQEKYGR